MHSKISLFSLKISSKSDRGSITDGRIRVDLEFDSFKKEKTSK